MAGSLAVHAASAATAIAVPGAWRLAASAMVANHVVLTGAGLWPRSSWLGRNLTRLDEPGDRVALTFDDGPDPEVTPAVLDRLDRAGARASFFCIGKRAEREPDLVREIAARGHRVENHTYSHANGFYFYGRGAMEREVDRAQALLGELTGREPRLVRAPAGIRNPWFQPVLEARGLVLASWTRRGFDTVARDPRAVAARLTRSLSAGDVLLLHDSGGAERRATVIETLDAVLAAIDAAGLRAAPFEPPGATARGDGAAA